MGVGEKVRDANDGAEPGDEARGRHSLQVRLPEDGRRDRGGNTAGRDLRGAVLVGGKVHAGPGRGQKGLK